MSNIRIGERVKIIKSNMPQLKEYIGNTGIIISTDNHTFSSTAYNVRFDSKTTYSNYLDYCSRACIYDIWFEEELEIIGDYYEL